MDHQHRRKFFLFFYCEHYSTSVPRLPGGTLPHSGFYPPPQRPWRMLSSVSKARVGHLAAHLCYTLCRAAVSPLSHHFLPLLIISTLHRSSAALLLWAVICSAIVQYILPPRSLTADTPGPPPPAAISISVRPDFTASWICTFSSHLCNLVTASSLPAVSCCVCFCLFFFLNVIYVVALFLLVQR